MAQTTSLVFNGGAIPSPAPTPSGSGKAKLLKIGEITITEQGVQVTKKVICDPDSVTTVAPFMEVLTSAKLAELVEANSILVLDDGDMQYLMSDANIAVEDGTFVCTAVNFLGLSKENRAKVLYPCTRLTDELTLQQVLEVGEPVETDFNLVKADSEDTKAGTLIDKLEVVDNVRDPEDPQDVPLLSLETTVDGQGNRKVAINEDTLKTFSGNVIDSIETLTELINELPSDEHGYFNSSLYTTPGDGTTTNLVMSDFRISENRDVHGDSIEFVPTHQEGGVDFGEVYLEPGTYILATQFTLQWVGNPRGTFLPKVCNVADQPFDFSYEHEDIIRTTRIVTKTTRGKLVLNIAIDADTPPMGVWVKNLEVAQIASYNHPAVVHDTTLTGKGQLGDPLGVTPAAFGKVKDIPTSISQFRTGDVIPVDGPNGPAKMEATAVLSYANSIVLSGKSLFILERESPTIFSRTFVCNENKKIKATVTSGYKVYLINESTSTVLFVGADIEASLKQGVLYKFSVKKIDDTAIDYDFELYVQDVTNYSEKIENIKDSLVDTSLGKSQVFGFKQSTRPDDPNPNLNRIYRLFNVNRKSGITIETLASGIKFILQKYNETTSQYDAIGGWSTIGTYDLNPSLYNIIVAHSDDSNITPDEDVKLWVTDRGGFVELLESSLGKAQVDVFYQGTRPGEAPPSRIRIYRTFSVYRHSNIKIETLESDIKFILQKYNETTSQYDAIGGWSNTSGTYDLEPSLYNVIVAHSDDSGITPDESINLWITDCGRPVESEVIALANQANEKAQAALDATVTMLGNYDIVCAASDTPTNLKRYAKYICRVDDARPDLQSAIYEAMNLGVKVKLLPGNYIINSRAEVNGTPVNCGLWFPNDKPNAEIYIKTNNVFHSFEGVILPIGYNSGAHIQMGAELFTNIGSNESFSLFACGSGQIYGRGLCVKNLSISLPSNSKPIVIVNGQTSFLIDFENLFVSGCDVQSVDYTDNNTGEMPPVANDGCVGIRGVAGSNWGVQNIINNCEVQGCGVGFELGGEHGFFTNLSAKYCTHGFTFSNYIGKYSIGSEVKFGVMGYPIICINLLDEHNVNLPKFGHISGSTVRQQGITIENYNIQWPNTCPGHPNRNDPNFLTGRSRAVETSNGWWTGRIDYMIDPVDGITQHPSLTPFFENGNGVNVVCTNIHMKKIGDSTTRLSYTPNLNQMFFDTTLNKMLIYDGHNWVDMFGSAV